MGFISCGHYAIVGVVRTIALRGRLLHVAAPGVEAILHALADPGHQHGLAGDGLLANRTVPETIYSSKKRLAQAAAPTMTTSWNMRFFVSAGDLYMDKIEAII